ncbi:MAG: ASCH domain-containing protein [Flavobacteriaceae bacterium]
MKTLHLTLKKKWFFLILSGVKKEEYREIKPYWSKRLTQRDNPFKFVKYDTITFKNGYSKNAPTMVVELKGVKYGECVPEWSDNYEGKAFVLSLGDILETKNY